MAKKGYRVGNGYFSVGAIIPWLWHTNRQVVEGVFTMFVSIMLLFLLPGSPDSPKPLLSPGIVRFSASDQAVLQRRLELDNSENRHGAQGMRIPLRTVWKTICHYRRWPHFISTCAVFSTWSPLTTYSPSIVMLVSPRLVPSSMLTRPRSLGFSRIAANALAAVGASLALVVVFFFAWISDKTNKRGLSVIAAQACYLITLIVTHSTHPHVGKWSRWGLWTVVNAFAVGYHPVHNSWVQLNCREPGERSVSIA